MPIYNKLVRDGIPAILELDNKAYIMNVLESAQHEVEIKRKLDEELKEYQQAASNEELHDSSIEE